jgi:DNA-binding NtrC family response regulator
MVSVLARTREPCLVTGGSGTGKELFVTLIHVESGRYPLITMNCPGVPDGLFESECFGHVRGAFTGADRDKPGLIEAAHGGTFFLDEIADLSPFHQAKLLRVLETGEVRRVGSNDCRFVDVRIIAATNKDLWRETAEGRFREDLYARLAVMQIHLPLLRDREGDIPLLLDHFVGLERFSREAMTVLEAYDWPLNVRELRSAVLGALAQAGEGPILPTHLPEPIRHPRALPALQGTGRTKGRLVTLAEMEREYILQVIDHTHGNQVRAAGILGIHRSTLAGKLREYGWLGAPTDDR